MSYTLTATAKKGYLCGFYCEKCGKFNITQGSVEAQHQLTTTFKPNDNHREEANRKAGENVQRVYDNLRAQVNDGHRFDHLKASGFCKECKTTQMWARRPEREKKEKLFFILGGVSVAVGALMGWLARSFWPYFLVSIVLGVIDLVLGIQLAKEMQDNLAADHTKRVEAAYKDKEHNCLPFVMSNGDKTNEDERSLLLGLILSQAEQK